MEHFITDFLPWVLSALTVYSVYLSGYKNRYSWLVGIVCQILWIIFAVTTKSWGLLPMNFIMIPLFFRNYLMWK